MRERPQEWGSQKGLRTLDDRERPQEAGWGRDHRSEDEGETTWMRMTERPQKSGWGRDHRGIRWGRDHRNEDDGETTEGRTAERTQEAGWRRDHTEWGWRREHSRRDNRNHRRQDNKPTYAKWLKEGSRMTDMFYRCTREAEPALEDLLPPFQNHNGWHLITSLTFQTSALNKWFESMPSWHKPIIMCVFVCVCFSVWVCVCVCVCVFLLLFVFLCAEFRQVCFVFLCAKFTPDRPGKGTVLYFHATVPLI